MEHRALARLAIPVALILVMALPGTSLAASTLTLITPNPVSYSFGRVGDTVTSSVTVKVDVTTGNSIHDPALTGIFSNIGPIGAANRHVTITLVPPCTNWSVSNKSPAYTGPGWSPSSTTQAYNLVGRGTGSGSSSCNITVTTSITIPAGTAANTYGGTIQWAAP